MSALDSLASVIGSQIVDGADGTITAAKLRQILLDLLNVSAPMRSRGNWQTSTSYAAQDFVFKDNSSWLCILAHTSDANNAPDGAQAAAYWQQLSGRGLPGVGGVPYEFDTTTTMADPGAGVVRANNATFGSVTALAVDDVSLLGVDVAAFVTSWDDSSSTNKGTIIIRAVDPTSSTLAIFTVTGVTDNAGWTQVAVTPVAGALPADEEEIAIQFVRTGDPGDMAAATYDPAGHAEQVVTEDATQTMTNKTLTSPVISSPTLTLTGSASPAPTVEGRVEWNTGSNILVIGTGSGSVNVLNEPLLSSTSGTSGADRIGIRDAGSIFTGTTVEAALQETIAQGKHTVWLPAASWSPRISVGPEFVTHDSGTNDHPFPAYAFDATTAEYLFTSIAMPKSWNKGTVTFQALWTADSGSGGVVWGLGSQAWGDNADLNVATANHVEVADTFLGAQRLHVAPESSAHTIPNAASIGGGIVLFQLYRNPANGSDTLAVDAKFLGLRLHIWLNAATDA